MLTPANHTRWRRRGGGGCRLRRVVLLRIRIARIGALSVSEVRRRGGSGGPGGCFAAGRAELAIEALRAERPQRQTDGLPEADQQVVELWPELSAKRENQRAIHSCAH